jgi:hypothetical protein
LYEHSAGNVITHESPRDYKQAVAYTLAQDYGFTRIMSSYYFTNTDQGPPSNGGYRYIKYSAPFIVSHLLTYFISLQLARLMLSLTVMAVAVADGFASIAGTS